MMITDGVRTLQRHSFIRWVGEDIFTIKAPELRRQTIVAAMYGTFDKNEAEARKFWQEVSRGGVEFEDNHPTTVLNAFLKSAIEDKKLELKLPKTSIRRAFTPGMHSVRVRRSRP
jgi:hypothetical protein